MLSSHCICSKTLFRIFIIITTCFAISAPQLSHAQYFGQNKVRYKNLKFKVYRTPHFEIYYYLNNDSVLKRFAQESELWYTLHQQIFRDTFKRPNPIILYANHPDFQQTTALDGEIGVGTGGVTEGLKNRVIMPLMETNQATRHVLGHELVHAFQYHLLLRSDSANLAALNNVPLWMVEGMAEYFSLGKKDAYTAMWMRDAYLNKDIPGIKQLTESNKYFPYRYGEAFWSYLSSTYGDSIVVPFFKNTARYGLQYGIRRTFGFDEKTLSTLWKNAIINAYQPYLKDTAQIPPGRKLIDNKNSGSMNVAPAVSPDGKFLAFLSERNLFSIDLFLADAGSGRIIKRLSSKTSNTHIDEFNFIESAGAWSPDSKRFAFSIFSKGRNRMLIVSVPDGKVLQDISMQQAEQFGNLTWSADGSTIAFQGMANGQPDLYLYHLQTHKITQLTNDKYSDYQPSFSHDGKKIVFTSDRFTYDQSTSQAITFNLCELNLVTGAISHIQAFNGANNLNPQYSADDRFIYFLSNRDGFRNLYRYQAQSNLIEQLTNLFTGISGITEFSPALSVSAHDDIVYSYYRSQRYTLYNAHPADFKPVPVDTSDLNFDAALLPPARSAGVDLINTNLNNFLAYPRIPTDSIRNVAYRPQFKMDYVASSGIGVGVSTYGAGLASGIQGVFSDILGRNQIYAGAAVNGTIYDFGAQLAYINQTSRWNKGVSLSHIPYQFANYTVAQTNYTNGSTTTPAFEYRSDIIRIFQDQATLFTAYPFSKTTRIEFGTGTSRYSYRVDRYSTFTDTTRNRNYLDYRHTNISNQDYEADRSNGITNLRGFTVFQLNTALVGDNSYFGIASPLSGFRYRLQAEYNLGTYHFFSPTIDVRRYIRIAPLTLAGRLTGFGRFGNSAGLYAYYLGYPFLIRGYESQTFYNNGNLTSTNGFTIDQLSGTRIAVANFEVRLPLSGPAKLSQFESKFLFTEINFFFDAGLAWNAGDQIRFKKTPDVIAYKTLSGTDGKPLLDADNNPVYAPVYNRVPALSAGISLRVNVLGAFVLEPYLAVPFNRSDVRKPIFGLNFAPGW